MMSVNEVLDTFIKVYNIPEIIDEDNNKWYCLNAIKFSTGINMYDFEDIMIYKYVNERPYITKTGLLKIIQEEPASIFKDYLKLLGEYKILTNNMKSLESIIKKY